MPSPKKSKKVIKKIHKKCGTKTTSGESCRHTAKNNGRCHAHRNFSVTIKHKKNPNKPSKFKKKPPKESPVKSTGKETV